MKSPLTLLSLVAVLVGCATYQEKILDPWIGASRAELVSAWGYPQHAADVVRIDDNVSVYTYRNGTLLNLNGVTSRCVVSFSIEADKVTTARANGSECRRIARPLKVNR